MNPLWLVLIMPLSYALGALTMAALIVCGDDFEMRSDDDDQLENPYR